MTDARTWTYCTLQCSIAACLHSLFQTAFPDATKLKDKVQDRSQGKRKALWPLNSIEILGHKAISADESSAPDNEARLQLRIVCTCRLRCRDVCLDFSQFCLQMWRSPQNASMLLFGPSLEECCYPFMVIVWKGIIGCPINSAPSRVFANAVQVVPGRAGGGSFRRKKNYIAKKEFAYRMCARRPTSAMPKPFLCCERAFCCSMVVMWPVLMHVMSFDVVVMSFDAMWLLVLCHVTWCNAMSCDVPCNGHVVCSKWFCDNVVIQSTILYYKVLLCTTKYYSSTTLYYKVLLQYYSVLHSTTTYYSSTTLYYKVLLQYYSVLQSTVLQRTTPVLPCTTKYYSSTTLYCKVLLQYYPVLQSTIPVLLCTTKYYSSTTLYYKVLLQYYSVLHSTTTYYSSTTLYYKVLLQYYSVLHSTTTYYSSTTLYYKVLLQYYSVLQSTTPVLPCTTKYYSSTALYYNSTTLYYKVLLQYYSVRHSATTYYSSTTLYYKVLLQYYSVLQSTTPILLCTTKYYSSTTLYYTVLQRTTPALPCTTKYYSSTTLYCKVLLQYYSVLQSTTPVLLCSTQCYNVLLQYYFVLQSSIHMNRHLHDRCSSHMKRHVQCAEQQESSSNFTKYCTCHAKWLWWLIRVTYETSFTMRGATGLTIQLYQILRLPRKMNPMIDPRLTYETSFRMRGATRVTLHLHQILRLPRKMNLMIDPPHIWNVI